jgi:signal transduction histidine kinase
MQARLMVAGRMASVGTLAAGLAHEINNPLASVLANLRLLEEAGGGLLQDPRELREVVADVLAGVERVRRIVEGLRLFTHTGDAGGVRLELPRVLDTAVALASSELRARAQLVREDRDAGPVVAHEGRLVQALVELLVNAAHAIPAGCPERHEIHVETRSDGPGRAIVAVRDTGVGIAPEQLGRVFDPFFTIPGAGGGTGLGLSTCHAIVTSLGGEITVESKPGAGSTFTVRLPAVGPDRHA